MSYKIYRIKKGCIILTWLNYGLEIEAVDMLLYAANFEKQPQGKCKFKYFVWTLSQYKVKCLIIFSNHAKLPEAETPVPWQHEMPAPNSNEMCLS